MREEIVGMCPACSEWTTVGESCCGRGAYVEGSLMSDEEVEEDEEATKESEVVNAKI